MSGKIELSPRIIEQIREGKAILFLGSVRKPKKYDFL